ncbi:DNA translocase FtsK [Brevibacillus thermoruber]|uniref:DNA translocase FtsK n=1 Tax=Brevibacillus thermoruber TaxID=33942 RepID=A0A9X3TSP5_9BACL|nr:DNA translocase FtsK [Brevibacillus thermoruber]MDA5109708.1 DNA translocase FtsK [Brevibacillus thermoruber]
MWSWLHKLIRYILGEEEQEWEQEREHAHRPPAGPSAGQLRAKTKSIYPKQRGDEQEPELPRREKQRHFRFPVISDEELRRPKKRGPVEADKPGRDAGLSSGGPDLIFRSGSSARGTADGMKPDEQVKPEVLQGKREAERLPREADRATVEPVRREERKAEPFRPARPTAEKRTYTPSEFISPVYGKMTPSTRETEHRIHTTSGVVYAGADSQRELADREAAAESDRTEVPTAAETDAVSADRGAWALPDEPAAGTAAKLPWTKREVPAAETGTGAGEAAAARAVPEAQAESAASDAATTLDLVFKNKAAAEAVAKTETVSETETVPSEKMEAGTEYAPAAQAVFRKEDGSDGNQPPLPVAPSVPDSAVNTETAETAAAANLPSVSETAAADGVMEAPAKAKCESPAETIETAAGDMAEVPTEPAETLAAVKSEAPEEPVEPLAAAMFEASAEPVETPAAAKSEAPEEPVETLASAKSEVPAAPDETLTAAMAEAPTEPAETPAAAMSDASAAKPLSPSWESSAPVLPARAHDEQPAAVGLDAAAEWTAREEETSAGETAASSASAVDQERASSAVGAAEPAASYVLPSLDLLDPSPPMSEDDDEHTQLQKLLLEETLANFNVNAQVVGIVKGPSVTRFELQPAPGVKVNKITSLIDDIKLNLAAKDIRIEAPIPGRNAVGIEVPNLTSQPVLISRIIGSAKFREHPSPLAVALGMDIGGEPIVADIKKMPHGLIAGATGSGKSVCINSIIVSLLYKATPEQVRLLLIDPKMVELAPYNHLPHLVTPVVTDAKQATAALKWAVEEMEKRYALFVDAGARDIERYNQTVDQPLPYIVIVIDELADLMMVSPQDVEECIIRIAQKARACGIHLLLATQRPSVDVITGNIKANVPTRLAFAVFSQVDSRTILDQSGAERLLGRGDMLFLESGVTPVRLQGNYVSDDEIERVTRAIKQQRKPSYLFSKEELEQQVQSYDMGDDPLYHEALLFVAEQGQASASALQRRFRIGYNRAARLIEMMEADGYVAGQSGGKPRAVLITREDAEALAEGSTLF